MIAEKILAPYDTAILVGDFNFDSTRNFNEGGDYLGYICALVILTRLENEVLVEILPQYVDTWPLLHPNDKGYTYDSEVNSVIKHYEQMRYDRVMIRSKTWVPTHISLLGNQPIKTNLFPSDHFGLCATFTKE
jgi:tyrosyl-DNA phosphodiesterase 2